MIRMPSNITFIQTVTEVVKNYFYKFQHQLRTHPPNEKNDVAHKKEKERIRLTM